MRLLVLHILLLVAALPLRAQHMEKIVDLHGHWRFEIGDDTAWADPGFDDSDWQLIRVPSFWENEGYPGYDGWAWYRTRFTVPGKHRYNALYLNLGTIDDVDEVYVNGHFIGFSGSPPPNYMTAYADARWYYVPFEYLHFDAPNVLAVRVFDNEMSGGISNGDIGVYLQRNYLFPDQSLRGTWKLRAGDLQEWKQPSYDDSRWPTAFVPLYWETQGLRDYDGYGWYRRSFTLDDALADERLILLLGKIDDVDQVWLNGRSIGKTGKMPEDGGYYVGSDSYNRLRAYFIPRGILKRRGENVIAVRVYDGFLHGGIYQGPIGLIRQDRFRTWQNRHPQDEKSGFERLMDALFGN